MPFNVMIIGHARHGKDTVADLLVENHGYKHISASKVILNEIIWPVLKPLYGSKAECFADRVNHRATWFDLIKAKLKTDPTLVAKKCLDGGNIYTGTRSRQELDDIRSLFDFIIWVDAFGRGIPAEPRSSMELEQSDADVTVYNEGDEAYCAEQVSTAVKWMEEHHEHRTPR